MLGKNRLKKSENTFFIFTRLYRDQKMGKKSRKQFFQKNTNRNVGKKIVTKSAKTRFLYSHEYHDQNVGRKMRETIFPETHE